MSELTSLLQAFFTQRLTSERNASPNTVTAYRDTFSLLLGFASEQAGRPPHLLTMSDLNAEVITTFLTHLETVRGNSVTTRNTRLAGIRSFFRYASYRCPEHAALIARVLDVQTKPKFLFIILWFLRVGRVVRSFQYTICSD